MRLVLKIVLSILGGCSFAQCQANVASLSDVAQHAIDQSKLILPGSAGFHLKATIIETTNPASEYKGEIEEYWVSPEKWQRRITSPSFSQTLIVNGSKASEVDKGDYFPWWLNDLTTAIFDPLPMLENLKHLNSQMPKPSGGEHATACARTQMKVGTPPAENSAFSVICFEGSRGLLESVVTPGYEALFNDYKSFKGKRVARRIVIDPESGTSIEAKVTELSELVSPTEDMFVVQQPTSAVARLNRVVISEAVLQKLSVSTPDILWPSVRSGKTSGVLSMYVSIDRDGHVREAWPLNSDNAGLEDPAREQVKKWQFKPASSEGVPVQVEAILTFAFNTRVGDPIPILSDEEARKLATNIVEPTFPPGSARGTEVKVQIGVSLDGTVNGVSNPYNAPTPLFMAAYGAVRQWRFRPYIRNGTPDLFGADVVFRIP